MWASGLYAFHNPVTDTFCQHLNRGLSQRPAAGTQVFILSTTTVDIGVPPANCP